jgi:hypothetical protein
MFLSVTDRHGAGEASAMMAAEVLCKIWRRVIRRIDDESADEMHSAQVAAKTR